MQCAGFEFLATLTSVGPRDIMTGAADMTSTFRFTVRAELNGTVVQCSGETSPSTPAESHNFIVAGKCYIAIIGKYPCKKRKLMCFLIYIYTRYAVSVVIKLCSLALCRLNR